MDANLTLHTSSKTRRTEERPFSVVVDRLLSLCRSPAPWKSTSPIFRCSLNLAPNSSQTTVEGPMLARSPTTSLAPLVLAAQRATSWVQVLQVYTTCCTHLQGIYQPAPAELQYGLSRMPNSWSTSLFYYDLIKKPLAPATPDKSLVLTALSRYKELGNTVALRRIIEEDVNGETVDGARAKLTLASAAGLWAEALSTLLSHPSLVASIGQRRSVLATLAMHHQWRLALRVLYMTPRVDKSPVLVRPLVRCFGRLGAYRSALRLVAASLAEGHPFSVALLLSIVPTLQETGQWTLALQAAGELHLFSLSKAEARQHFFLYIQLVNCLYEADVYGARDMEEVVQEVEYRIHPREAQALRCGARTKPFRMCSPTEVFQQFQSVLLPLTSVFAKILNIPRWYSRGISAIVDVAVAENAVTMVLDTNFLMQIAGKQLPLEHFYTYMKDQYPDLRSYTFGTVVVPFTTLAEAYTLIWKSKDRFSRSARLLLWSRIVALLQQPNVYALSIAGEFPCSSFSIIPKLVYRKMPDNVAGIFQHDPDLRILSVCVALQHYFRVAQVQSNMSGVRVPEGVLLFALLKYQVRRYRNTAKGCSVDRLLLCTLDKRMSRAATEMGIRVFPSVWS